MSYLYHCLNDEVPPSFEDYFKRRHTRQTRQQNKLEVPRSRLVIGQSRIECKGPNLWNKIDSRISSLTERNPFKNELVTDKLNAYIVHN